MHFFACATQCWIFPSLRNIGKIKNLEKWNLAIFRKLSHSDPVFNEAFCFRITSRIQCPEKKLSFFGHPLYWPNVFNFLVPIERVKNLNKFEKIESWNFINFLGISSFTLTDFYETMKLFQVKCPIRKRVEDKLIVHASQRSDNSLGTLLLWSFSAELFANTR